MVWHEGRAGGWTEAGWVYYGELECPGVFSRTRGASHSPRGPSFYTIHALAAEFLDQLDDPGTGPVNGEGDRFVSLNLHLLDNSKNQIERETH